ncbi:predicted protein [Nematostella vectensis]|uniref:Fibrinogen C-terminal domain-containing protein n=1 Tax=Nematostella vectensis TaxID=45351 RepID=A7SYM5_NEMVE|nr:predicted protein [Nematostella vectensis]|eukprot:XP_001623281.1 predicted protein [Nematostella vectensis]
MFTHSFTHRLGVLPKDGGGWTVFQRRQDGSMDFFRGWDDYKSGFGNLTGEFWLGLENILTLTNQTKNRLRVDLMDWDHNTSYAEYDEFAVSSGKYNLQLGSYTGENIILVEEMFRTARDSLSYNRGQAFSTKEESSCARERKGAWWYRSCTRVNLNGFYFINNETSGRDGIHWYEWRGESYSLKRSEMKIRPADFVPN